MHYCQSNYSIGVLSLDVNIHKTDTYLLEKAYDNSSNSL